MTGHDSHQDVQAQLVPRGFWVLDTAVDDGLLERLADARELADRAGGIAGVLIIGEPPADCERLIHAGADQVCVVALAEIGQNSFVAAAAEYLRPRFPRAVFASYELFGRECACRLAARCGWRLVSPALLVRPSGDALIATGLDPAGRRARQVAIGSDETVVAAFRPGVGAARPPDTNRRGAIERRSATPLPEAVVSRRRVAADPAQADIRHVRRLIAGGRGLGGAAGFDLLRRVASKLDAGIAASRAAVDLGWVEHARQVGQTGKTVSPDLYIACGISGASHHWEGMSHSAHIVAINTDREAPLMARAHLALEADLHQVLEEVERELSR